MDITSILSLFIQLAGFVIGLGAVTVIDLHGFLGRKSSYWSEATTRTHKITKPLIWIGITLCLIGGILNYTKSTDTTYIFLHLILVSALILNGIFLSFYVSPFLLKREKEGKSKELLPSSLQNKIFVSLIFSDIGWWGGLLLLCIYLVTK